MSFFSLQQRVVLIITDTYALGNDFQKYRVVIYQSRGYQFISLYVFYLAQQFPLGQGLLIHEFSRSHSFGIDRRIAYANRKYHSRQDSSWKSGQPVAERPLPDNTQHSQHTNVTCPRWDSNLRSQHASGFKLHDHWDRHQSVLTNSVALVRERTVPTERPPPVGEVSANFCAQRGVTWSAQRIPTAV